MTKDQEKKLFEAIKVMVTSWERKPNFQPQIDLSRYEAYFYEVMEEIFCDKNK